MVEHKNITLNKSRANVEKSTQIVNHKACFVPGLLQLKCQKKMVGFSIPSEHLPSRKLGLEDDCFLLGRQKAYFQGRNALRFRELFFPISFWLVNLPPPNVPPPDG